jgi:RecT family
MNLIPVNDMGIMADAIVKSQFYGFKSKEQVLAVMLVAQAEGKHPATVVQEYDIIQGRPALKSQAMLARFQLSGGKVEWHEMTAKKVSGTFTHPNGGSLTIEWTIEMAKQAGVYREGSGWTKYPEDMLTARVISRAVRKVYPACILGHYAVEEVVDFEPIAPKNITPPRAPVQEIDFNDMNQDISDPEIAARLKYKVLIPPGVVYSAFETEDEWVECMADLINKVKQSKKLSTEEMIAKIKSLEHVNREQRLKMNATVISKLNMLTMGSDSKKPSAPDQAED